MRRMRAIGYTLVHLLLPRAGRFLGNASTHGPPPPPLLLLCAAATTAAALTIAPGYTPSVVVSGRGRSSAPAPRHAALLCS
jgi:hypothetical protein